MYYKSGGLKRITFVCVSAAFQKRQAERYSALRTAISELIDWRRQLMTGTFTHDHLRDMRLRITTHIDRGNRYRPISFPFCFFFSTSVVLSFSLSLQNDDYSGVIVNGHWLEPRTCSSCFNFSCFFKWNWFMAIGKSYDRIFYCQLPFTGTGINSIVGRQQVPIVFFELELELKNRTFQQYVYLNHIFKKMKEKKSCKPQKMKSSSKKKSWW